MLKKQQKCPNCLSTLLTEKDGKVVCSSCGSVFTESRYAFLDDDIQDKYNRAVEARVAMKLEESIRILESLQSKIPDCAEIYYQTVLSKLGVSFVDESGVVKTTISRLVTSPIDSLREVILTRKYASKEFIDEYNLVFSRLEEIRLKSIKIANTVESFDVFICFKQHPDDKKNMLTADYKVAKEIYDYLVSKNIKTFFSPISLPPGSDFEPYIYHALQTSKIMLVVAASPDEDYLTSPWVQNEWSRFSALAKTQDKTIIPVLANGYKADYLPAQLYVKEAVDYDGSFWDDLKPILKKYNLIKEKTVKPASYKKTIIIASSIVGVAVIATGVIVPIAVSKNKSVTVIKNDYINASGENTDPEYDGSISSITITVNSGTGYAVTAGHSAKISGYYKPTNATESYHFEANNSEIVDFSGATATGKKAGKTKIYVISDNNHVKSNTLDFVVWELEYENTYTLYNFNANSETIEICELSDINLYFDNRFVGTNSSMLFNYSIRFTKTYQDSSSSQKKFGMHFKIYDSKNTLVGQSSSAIKTAEFNQGESTVLSNSFYLNNTTVFAEGTYRVEYIPIRWTDVY